MSITPARLQKTFEKNFSPYSISPGKDTKLFNSLLPAIARGINYAAI
jgi:hypothetical protein